MQKTAVLCRKTDFLNIYYRTVGKRSNRHTHVCYCHNTGWNRINRVLFRFISSRCMGRYSDVQYFPIHVLSMYIFFKMYIHVSSDRLQTHFPSYPCPSECTNYCSFQIYRIEYHPIPASELIIAQGGGRYHYFQYFFLT